ncbi:MFS transporter [Embleya hyalina]|uniref:MFS transporter n=1 Tax=Embleya hyalina TaxID=516124 RepID=A0A401YK77_9ACTN|nr:MFS transporter [Embleya hyalina]GCD94987.1 MFS transporter [Embleya hyalina]
MSGEVDATGSVGARGALGATAGGAAGSAVAAGVDADAVAGAGTGAAAGGVEDGSGREGPSVGGGSAFWRYWAALTISHAGDAVTAVALPLIALRGLHATSLQVSLITAAQYTAWILIGLPAGVIVQRLPLRGTQVAMDVVRAIAIASVPIAWVLDVLGLWQLVVVAFVVGLASVVFDVGNSTLLPSIVSREELTSRNSLTSGSAAATQLGGPSLAGVLVQLCGAASGLLVDAISYLLSAVLLRTLPRPARQTPSDGGPSLRARMAEGLRYVRRHPAIRPCVAAVTAVNFVCGALMALVPALLVRTLHAPTALVGVLIATEGFGSLIGAALTTRLVARFGSARTLIGAALLTPVAVGCVPFAGHGLGLLVFAAANAAFGAAVVVMSIVTRTHRQTVTPPELLPRVMATVRFVSWGAIPFGALTAGLAATWLGNRGALGTMFGVALLTPVVLGTSPIRRMRDLV